MNCFDTKIEIIGSEDILNKIKNAIEDPDIIKKYKSLYNYDIFDDYVYAEYILKELHVNIKKYWEWDIRAWWRHPNHISQNKLILEQLSQNLSNEGWHGASMLKSQFPSEIAAIAFIEV